MKDKKSGTQLLTPWQVTETELSHNRFKLIARTLLLSAYFKEQSYVKKD